MLSPIDKSGPDVGEALHTLEPRLRDFICRNSATVWPYIRFLGKDMDELLHILSETGQKVRQIVYIIAEGDHTLSRYNTQSIRDKYAFVHPPESYPESDLYRPQFFGIIEHTHGPGITLQFLLPDVTLSESPRQNLRNLRKPVKNALELYRELTTKIIEAGLSVRDQVVHLGFVGSLPAVVIHMGDHVGLTRDEELMLEEKYDIAAHYVGTGVYSLARSKGYNLTSDSCIILGSNGMLGRRVVNVLKGLGVECVVEIDRGDGGIFALIRGRKIVVDCTFGSIEEYGPALNSLDIFVNEAFRTLPMSVIADMRDKGIGVYHIVGASGKSSPPLLGGYEGGVPCCMVDDTSQGDTIIIDLCGG